MVCFEERYKMLTNDLHQVTTVPYFDYAISAVIHDIDLVDTKTLAIAAKDGVYICENRTGVVKHYHHTQESIHTVAVLDDERLIFGGEDNRLTMFNYKTQKVIYTFAVSHQVLEIKKLDDNQLVFSCKSKEVFFFNYNIQKIVHTHHTGEHYGNMPLPWIGAIEMVESDLIVFGGSDCKLTFFNFKTKEVVITYLTAGWVRSIAVTPDKLVATDGGSDKLYIYDYKKRERFHIRYKKDNYIHAMCCFDDHTLVYCGMKFFDYKRKEIEDMIELEYNPFVIKKTDTNCIAFGGRTKELSFLDYRTKDIFTIPTIDQIKSVMEIKQYIYLYLFTDYLVIFDYKNKRVVNNMNIGFRRVYELNEDMIVFSDGLYNLSIYDLNKRRVIRKFTSEIDRLKRENSVKRKIRGYARLNDFSFVYAKGNTLFSYDIKTDISTKLPYVADYKVEDIYKIVSLDRDILVFSEDKRYITFYNYKTDEILFQTDALSSDKPNTFIKLDDESIACCTGEGNFVTIINYKTQTYEKEAIVTKTAVQNIYKIDDALIALVEYDNTLSFYDYKSRKIVYRKKMTHKVFDVTKTTDNLIAIAGEKETVSYLDYWGSGDIISAMKFFNDGIISIYDFQNSELTLLNRRELFTTLDKKTLDRHAWYINNQGHVVSYKKFRDRLVFDKYEQNKVVLK